MSSVQTPIHRVQGMGASHSGTGHFWRQRVTAIALVPLGLWFGFTVLGLAGGNEVDALNYFEHPVNAILMGGFVIIMLYHMSLGLQVIIDDYVHSPGAKIFLLLLVRFVMLATMSTCLIALIRIAVP
jgi:succinate dehydrogenase / fumarate reductase membrane anchor subunit